MHERHGESHSRLWTIWQSMKGRCYCPTSTSWKNYGARGIKVCRAWQEYLPFRRWALSHGYAEDLTLHRLNVRKNYTPANCTWADLSTQARCTRLTKYFTAWGETKSTPDWGDDPRCVVTTQALRIRLLKGWEPEWAMKEVWLPHKSPGKSSYMGVSWHNQTKRWSVCFKRKFVGEYDTEIEAAAAWDAVARAFFGEDFPGNLSEKKAQD